MQCFYFFIDVFGFVNIVICESCNTFISVVDDLFLCN